MKRRLDTSDAGQQASLPRFFAFVFGAFLGIAPVKFGNPPIMEKWVTAPTNVYEFVLGNPWPISWAYGLLAFVGLIGLVAAPRKLKVPAWLLVLPLLWLVWELISGLWTVNPELTKPTLAHFCACAACFYLGYFSLSGVRPPGLFLPGLLCGLLIVIGIGWEQQFGGLEQTRQYFFLYLYPRLKEVPPEYLKKIGSTRIFSTLFYPNALAGAMLLLLPVALAMIWEAREKFTKGARLFLAAVVGLGGLGCLYWSGSKGGWLLMLILGLISLLRLPFSRTFKSSLVALVLAVGLVGFIWKYAGFFEKGATSVSARFDYWRAAAQTSLTHPLVGTGPGTFSIAYQKLKRPESEMARLVHNDYLEQASDSGLPGFILYTVFIVSVLVMTLPVRDPASIRTLTWRSWFTAERVQSQTQPAPIAKPTVGMKSSGYESPVLFALWLGVFGWALQGLLEFGLYIPGLAWPAFAFMGLLLSRRPSLQGSPAIQIGGFRPS